MTTSAHSPTLGGSSTGHRDDIAEITRLIADVQTAYNTNDPELMTVHFTENARVVNAMGAAITGRAAILEANRQGLAGFLPDEYVRYDVTGFTFPRPDVALAAKEARATTPNGELIDAEPAMVALYVLVKEDGRWWFTARQSTLVPR